MAKPIVYLFMFLCASASWASSCGESYFFQGKNLYLQISYDDACDGEGGVRFTREVNRHGKPDYQKLNNEKWFDFKDECAFSFDKAHDASYLSCHAQGKTPLAGAKYLLKQTGVYTLKCGDLGSFPDVPRM